MVVLVLLIGFPFRFSLVLSRWLGTPQESLGHDQVFAQLTVPFVPTSSVDSLAYGNLLFVRLQMLEASRGELLRSLNGFETSRGPLKKPISLELERPWWSPPKGQEGTYWVRSAVTVWNPDGQPDTFYAVIQR